jgi:hypothetical protein
MQRKFGDNAIWVYEVLRCVSYSERKKNHLLNAVVLLMFNNSGIDRTEGPYKTI